MHGKLCTRKGAWLRMDDQAGKIYLSLMVATYDLSLRLQVMRLLLNINFSGMIVILVYKPAITFSFTLWLLSVMNTSIKD